MPLSLNAFRGSVSINARSCLLKAGSKGKWCKVLLINPVGIIFIGSLIKAFGDNKSMWK